MSVTGITTGIAWKKKENLAGDAKGKLLGLEAGGKGSIGEAGALAGGAREPTGLSSWGKGGGGDVQSGSNKSKGVVCEIVVGNDDDKGARWVGSKEQLSGGECANGASSKGKSEEPGEQRRQERSEE